LCTGYSRIRKQRFEFGLEFGLELGLILGLELGLMLGLELGLGLESGLMLGIGSGLELCTGYCRIRKQRWVTDRTSLIVGFKPNSNTNTNSNSNPNPNVNPDRLLYCSKRRRSGGIGRALQS
jgi:hypothetical protein